VRPTDQPPEGATHKDAKPVLSFTAKRRGKAPSHLADLDAAGRKQVLKDLGLPAFRADQLSRHYFTHFEADPERMSDIPAGMRAQVREALLPTLVSKVVSLEADGGRTMKDLWRLYDGAQVESVLMRYPQRTTLCVSSQAGCGMACPFCATGQMGLTRNLSTAEIVDQVRYAQAACRDGVLAGGPTTLSNIVFMGMGEPLANYKTVIGALHRLIDPAPEGFGMSARNITVSTVGLVPAIRKLAGEGMPVTLAVSLHAPDDDLRDELIPINSRWKGGELLDARPWVLVATPATSPNALSAVRQLAIDLGALPTQLGAAEHDRAVALISHTPQLVASALAARLEQAPEMALNLAGQGLRDTTRIAASDPRLWAAILNANRSSVSQVLRELRVDIDALIEALEQGRGSVGTVVDVMQRGNLGRDRIPGKHGGAPSRYAEVMVLIPDAPGQLARLFNDVGAAQVNIEDLVIEHSAGQRQGLATLLVAPAAAVGLRQALEQQGWKIVAN